jgi:TolA-binding protein
MRFLMTFALLAATSAFGQSTSTCASLDSPTVNCRTAAGPQTRHYFPNMGTAALEGQQTVSNFATAPSQQQLLRLQIETERLQTELLQKQIEIQQQQLEQQRLQLEAAKDHQMRLERLRRSMVTGAPCLKSRTPDYCAARDPDLRAAKDDVASGRISEAEFIQAAQAADKQLKAHQAASQ